MKLAITVLATLLLAAPASAAAKPSISVSPSSLGVGETVEITGRGYMVFENCVRRVSVSLRSSQNVVSLGRARVSSRGRFTLEVTPHDRNAGNGRWRVVASQRCESGDDGEPFAIRAGTTLTLR
jgi:hypothetical protein